MSETRRPTGSALGRRGKEAEKVVQEYLDLRASRSSFAYHRFPDARAARGALAAQPSDFLVCLDRSGWKSTFFLEVKETESVRSLPVSKLRQYGKLRMFHLAGASVLVAVHHKPRGCWVALREPDLFKAEVQTSFNLLGLHPYDNHEELLDDHLYL